MRVYSHTLNIRTFEKDFSHLLNTFNIWDNQEPIIKDVLERVSLAKADIHTFLRDVDSIEDEEVRKCCRSAAIAQMYNVGPSYGRYPHIAKQNEWVLLLVFKHDTGERPVYSTAVVSKYGDIIIHEGEINAYTQSNYGWGWIVKSAMDEKYGFISDYGDLLIPCFFDYRYLNDSGEVRFIYKSIAFQLRVYGKQSKLEKRWLETLLDYSEHEDFIICRSKAGVLFVLIADRDLVDSHGQHVDEIKKRRDGTPVKVPREADPAVFQEALEEVKSQLSPFIVSREELKQLVGKRSCGYELSKDGRSCIIYDDVIEIKDKRFMSPKLESIEVEDGNPCYSSNGNCLLTKDGKTLICGCKASIIPNSVTKIGKDAFKDCTGLTSIVIPSGVTEIGESAFYGCADLTSIVIPNTMEQIGNNAFLGCGLTSIKIPSSVTTIGNDAFAVCQHLTAVEIPDSINDYNVFHIEYLKDIYLPAGGPMCYHGFVWRTSSFLPLQGYERRYKQRITLHVPSGTEEEYKADPFFGQFGNIVAI